MRPDRRRQRDDSATLQDLFGGRSQLLVYHFMFGPDYTAGCPACSAIADGFNGFVIHLENHGVAFTAVSRAPLEKLQACKRRMGWSFPWASSFGSDFNYDFNTSVTEEQQRVGMVEYNFRTNDARYRQEAVTEGPRAEFAAGAGTDWETFTREGLLREETGEPRPPVDVSCEQAAAAAVEALGEERFDAAYAAGRALSLDDAVTLALEVIDA